MPSPGEAAIDDRQPEVPREVADQVAEGERDEQAAHSLATRKSAPSSAAAAAATQARRVDRLAGQLGPRCGETGGS